MKITSKEETAIGPWLFVTLLIVPTLGLGLVTFTALIASVMGPNGYLGIPVAAVFSLPGLAAIHLLAGKYPRLTLIEQGERILGRIAGRVAGACYLAVSLALLATLTRDMTNMVGVYFLDNTPAYILTATFLLIAAYQASRGIETVARFASFILLPSLLVMLALVAVGYQNITWTRVMPVLGPGILDYARGGAATVNGFYLLGIAAMVLPYLTRPRSFPRLAGGSILLLTLFFAAIYFGAIGVYGHRFLPRLAWPVMEFVHAIDFPYFLLEHAGLLFLIDWLTLFASGIGYLYYAVVLGSSQLSGVLDYKRWAWLLLPAMFALTMLTGNVIQAKFAVTLVARYGWIVFFGYPTVLWLISVLAGRKEEAINAA